jgi:sulfite reductase (NADPH) flavoprotein alpha-component
MPDQVLIVLLILAGLLLIWLCLIACLLWQRHKQTQMTTDWLIVYASQTGSAQAWACQTAQQLQQIDQSAVVIDIQQLTMQHLAHHQVLWVVSTYGDGDAPDHAQAFVKQIMSLSLDLSHMAYAILALGDRRYPQFCQFGHNLSTWLDHQQAKALFPMICVDHLHTTDWIRWNTALELVTEQALDLASPAPQAVWHEAQLCHRVQLNPGSLGEPIFQIGLTALGDLVWTSGDILEIQCQNTQALIDDFVIGKTWAQSTSIIESLRHVNLRTAPPFETQSSFQTWLTQCEPLPYREYSIASLMQHAQLELVIRQQRDATGLGLGSGWLTAGAPLGQRLSCRVRANPTFHLPNDDCPLILIGHGTGIAGLVAHLRQRAQRQHHENWLIFGERQRQVDHLYQAELDHWQQQGVLTYVDYAFSRDQVDRVYVQDRLRQQAERLQSWVIRGAAIYVCGSLLGMAQQVDQTLLELLGEAKLEQLRRQQRYQRDVY